MKRNPLNVVEDTEHGNGNHSLESQGIAFRGKPAEVPIMKKAPAVVFRQSKHSLPYFAHQQLDPDYFPRGRSTSDVWKWWSFSDSDR